MGCGCKNKEYHPCQNGGKCKCGGRCKKENYSNAAGSLDEFKDESKNIGKSILFFVGGVGLLVTGIIIYYKMKNKNKEI